MKLRFGLGGTAAVFEVFFPADTVDGRNPAPPGMYEIL